MPCPLCNEKFFPASLPFHQKQCEKRRGQRIVPCPYCGKEVTQLELPEHVKVCPKGAGAQAKKQAARSAASTQHDRTMRAEPEEVSAGDGHYAPQVLDDGRMGCVYCGRFFNPDRIDKHQQICGKLQSARPKGLDGQSTQAPKKVFNAAAARSGQGSAFVSAQQANRIQERQQQEIMKERTRAKKNNWRRAHEEFQAACKAGRGEEVPQRAPAAPTGIMCPHCGRHFSEDAAERHIPICAKVINKPKPPPSPARSPDPIGRNTRGTSSPAACRDERGSSGRGTPDSPARLRRPVSKDRHNNVTPRSTAQRINDSSAPGRGGSRSASLSRLPAVDGHAPKSAGGAMNAARDLRRQESETKLSNSSSCEKLPHLGNSPGNTTGSVRKPPTAPRQKPQDNTSFGDHSGSIDDDAIDQASQISNGFVGRVGLRRCAMMYRLLSAVPQEMLTRELSECGVDSTDNMDQEGLIEAIIQQLA